MPAAPIEHLRRAPGVVAGVRGEINRGIEVAAREEAGEVVRGAVATKPLQAIAEGVREGAAVEQRHPVASGEETPGEEIPDEAGAADDEDLHEPAEW
jgi:hypothetical protein